MLYMHYLSFFSCWFSLQCKDNKLFLKRSFKVCNQTLDFNHFNNLSIFYYLIYVNFSLLMKLSLTLQSL